MKPLWQNFWMVLQFYFFGFSGVSISTDNWRNVLATLLKKVGFFFPKKEATSFYNAVNKKYTVKPLKYGHQRDRTKFPLYRGGRIIEVGNVWFLAFLRPNKLPIIERCPYYRDVRKERLDCHNKIWMLT